MSSSAPGSVIVVVGNPKPASRTAVLGELVASRLHGLAPEGERGEIVLIDLAGHGPELLGWGDPTVAELKAIVLGARALVVASPTYKAAYTGLLKLFLDQFGADELGGMPTVAVMTGGSEAHRLAVDVHLAPVLLEIGASLPARGLYVCGVDVDDPASAVDVWFARAAPALAAALAADVRGSARP